jgi:hypothetical protein
MALNNLNSLYDQGDLSGKENLRKVAASTGRSAIAVAWPALR